MTWRQVLVVSGCKIFNAYQLGITANMNGITVTHLQPTKFAALLLLGLLLSACSSEDVEWIEVPLKDNVFFQEELVSRTDTIEIPLFAGADLEYKLGMRLGNSVSYNWQAANLRSPDDLLIEFHGHTIRESDEPGDVMFYKRHRADTASGYMVAPFDGIHGWYFDNQSNRDIVITLNVSGFYELQ